MQPCRACHSLSFSAHQEELKVFENGAIAGETAANALKQRIGSSSIACQVKTKDLYQRNVSSCNLPGTGDIGDWLVKNGYAVAYRCTSDTCLKKRRQNEEEASAS